MYFSNIQNTITVVLVMLYRLLQINRHIIFELLLPPGDQVEYYYKSQSLPRHCLSDLSEGY